MKKISQIMDQIQNRFGTMWNRPLVNKGITFSNPSLTMQQFKDECDMGKIIDRYKKTGAFYSPDMLVNKTPRTPQFGDFSEIPDKLDALNAQTFAERQFDALPLDIKQKFGNYAEMVMFLENPANRDEAVKLGLLDEKKLPIEPEKKLPIEPEKTKGSNE